MGDIEEEVRQNVEPRYGQQRYSPFHAAADGPLSSRVEEPEVQSDGRHHGPSAPDVAAGESMTRAHQRTAQAVDQRDGDEPEIVISEQHEMTGKEDRIDRRKRVPRDA